MEKYETLRARHKEFIYHGYDIADNGFFFHFSIDGYHFYPSWKCGDGLLKDISPLCEYIIFNIGMAELVSYWKCACPPVVRIKCGHLNAEQCRWWKKLYFGGLSEFFYRNGINADFDTFMTIIPDSDITPQFVFDKTPSGCLIPIGGGKDSVVTVELLRGYHDISSAYIINPRGATLNCAKTAGFDGDAVIGVRRAIDTALLERNAAGYLNGHTPFSAIVAFSAYLFAYITDKKYIVLSNESSANEANVSGSDVNHQYSKSTEFERDFREYAQRFMGGGIEYFSFLRPLCEWQITKLFVNFTQYFGVFQSCNLGSKTDVWCCNCAKCLYVYIMLAAFLDDERLYEIFGENMLEKTSMSDIFDGLVNDGTDKPFECVGTKQEVRLALYTAAQKRQGHLPALLERYMKTVTAAPESLDGYFDDENCLPPEFLDIVKEKCNEYIR